MGFQQILNEIGNQYTSLVNKILSFIPESIISSSTTTKVISLLIPTLIIFVLIKFVEGIKPIVKYIIIGLSILLIVSVFVTFTG